MNEVIPMLLVADKAKPSRASRLPELIANGTIKGYFWWAISACFPVDISPNKNTNLFSMVYDLPVI
jgi:hypothetical protein